MRDNVRFFCKTIFIATTFIPFLCMSMDCPAPKKYQLKKTTSSSQQSIDEEVSDFDNSFDNSMDTPLAIFFPFTDKKLQFSPEAKAQINAQCLAIRKQKEKEEEKKLIAILQKETAELREKYLRTIETEKEVRTKIEIEQQKKIIFDSVTKKQCPPKKSAPSYNHLPPIQALMKITGSRTMAQLKEYLSDLHNDIQNNKLKIEIAHVNKEKKLLHGKINDKNSYTFCPVSRKLTIEEHPYSSLSLTSTESTESYSSSSEHCD
jgi:hypothetical protein